MNGFRFSILIASVLGLAVIHAIKSAYAADGLTSNQMKQSELNVLKDAETPPADRYKPVSMIQLIANPEKYDNEKVEVFGYLYVEKEGQFLFFDENTYKFDDIAKAIQFNLETGEYAKQSVKQWLTLSCRYGSISGTFHMFGGGHPTLFSTGEITDIALIQLKQYKGYCGKEIDNKAKP